LLPSGIAQGGCFPRARPQPRRENHSSGLRTRAFRAGVTALHSPGLVKLCDEILITLTNAVNRLTPNQLWEIYEDSCGRKGIGETLKCVSMKGLTSRPRKAKYISRSGSRSFYILIEINQSYFVWSRYCGKNSNTFQ
jgi:hypothetical protein